MRIAVRKFFGHHPNFVKYFVIEFSVAIVFALSFQYFFLTDYPIGPDVVNHIAHEVYLEKIGYLKAFSTFLYPLSLIAFNICHKFLALFDFTWERSFIFVLCFNVFIVAILTGTLAGKIFKDWKVGVLASILLASSRWINDSMRIGLIAESFGWIFLLVSLIFLFEKKWKYLIPSTILLFFFHPMVFGVFLSFLGIVLVYLAIWGEKKDKKTTRYFLLLLAFFTILFFTSKNMIFQGILDIVHLNFQREGERSVLNFVTDSDKRRVFIYAIALIGFILSVFKLKRKNKDEKILFLILFTVFSFMVCFKHLLGIHYLSYRFYTYFEVATAIYAGYGVIAISKMLPNEKSILVFFPLTCLLVLPNWKVNLSLTRWQLTDFKIGSTTPLADRQVIAETSTMVKPNSRIIGSSFWGYWYLSKSSSNYIMTPIIYSDDKLLYEYLYQNDVSYVFLSSTDQKTPNEASDYLKLVYQKDEAKLYEFIK